MIYTALALFAVTGFIGFMGILDLERPRSTLSLVFSAVAFGMLFTFLGLLLVTLNHKGLDPGINSLHSKEESIAVNVLVGMMASFMYMVAARLIAPLSEKE
jgi:amino acid transporter